MVFGYFKVVDKKAAASVDFFNRKDAVSRSRAWMVECPRAVVSARLSIALFSGSPSMW